MGDVYDLLYHNRKSYTKPFLYRNGSPEDAAIVTKALIMSTEKCKALNVSNCSLANYMDAN